MNTKFFQLMCSIFAFASISFADACVDGHGKYSPPADLLTKATSGDVVAQERIGSHYLSSECPGDREKGGVFWLNKAASSGSATAQDELGWYYVQKIKEAPDNYEKAFKLLSEASDSGYMPARFHLGLMYYGEGKHHDDKKAFLLIKQSADAGITEAEIFCGNMLISGTGVEKNPVAGFGLVKHAAETGDSAALLMLSGLYLGGVGTPKNPSEAIRILKSTVKLGGEVSIQSAYMLGMSYAECGSAVYDKKAAEKWFSMAAKSHYVDAEKKLTILNSPKPCVEI